MDPTDPDDYALLLVQQYLQERGYSKALKETEQQHGLKYVDSKLPKGSMLLQMVYDALEKEAASFGDDEEAEFQAMEEDLLQGGLNDFPSTQSACISGLHSSNITSVCSCSGSDTIFTGSGDGSTQAITASGESKWLSRRSGSGGAISLSLHSKHRSRQARLLVGYMDGTVAVLDAAEGRVLAQAKLHSKYVVKAVWAPGAEDLVVSISWDGTVTVSEYSTSAGGEGQLKAKQTLPFPTAIQDVVFLPGGDRIMVALRDTNMLRMRNFPAIEQGDEKVNLNALKDNHVSFSARQLQVSPDSKYLLVSTDTSRIVLLRIKGWKHLSAQIVGLPLDTFHNSIACWHASSYYIMAAAAAGQIYVFHVGSGKVVAKYKAHEQNVRGLDYDADRNLLVSCSFDRTVKIWRS